VTDVPGDTAQTGADADAGEAGQLRQAVARFARERLAPAVLAAERDCSGRLEREPFLALTRDAARLGLPGLLIPGEYGGGGGRHGDLVTVMEELGGVDAGFAAALNLTMTVPAFLLAAGSAAQRAQWLPPIAAGDQILAGAMNEPSLAGSDLFNPDPEAPSGYRTRATSRDGGYRIDGAKAQWVTNASVATAYLVFARTAPDHPAMDAVSAFYVPDGAPGLSSGPRSHLLGLRSGFHAEVYLDGVDVPAEARIGPEGQALRLLMTSTPGMAVGLAAVFAGVARTAVQLAIAHTGQRHSWGRPLREHQAVALELAEMEMRARSARLLVRDAAGALDDGAAPRELAIATATAKSQAVEAAIACAEGAVRLHGAAGVTSGAGPEKLLRDAWTGYACDFTGDMLRLAIAAAL
jgi:alkylation response protein AidB-like acyl-CoA dehydrogenase